MSYMAEQAKVKLAVSRNTFGLVFNVDCFDESLKPFYNKLIEELVRFKEDGFSEERFKVRRDNHETQLMKSRNSTPF